MQLQTERRTYLQTDSKQTDGYRIVQNNSNLQYVKNPQNLTENHENRVSTTPRLRADADISF